MLDCNSPAIVF
jgi:hypothetical protein